MPRPRQAPSPSLTAVTEGIKDPAVAAALHAMAQDVNTSLKRVTLVDTPNNHLVSSPDGSIYALQVSNTGVVTSTKIKSA